MFKETEAVSGFSVPDIDAAKEFYSDTLGIEVTDEGGGGIALRTAGGRTTFVYPKDDHEPAVYTILNFVVDDIDWAVDGLTERGVSFERYEGFDQDDKGIVRGIDQDQGPNIAWFTDPAGNILSVMQVPGD